MRQALGYVLLPPRRTASSVKGLLVSLKYLREEILMISPPLQLCLSSDKFVVLVASRRLILSLAYRGEWAARCVYDNTATLTPPVRCFGGAERINSRRSLFSATVDQN